jgi:hypothetical protein
MQSEDRRARMCWLAGAFCLLFAIAVGTGSAQQDGNWRARVSADLLQIYQSTTTKSEVGSFGKAPPHARFDSSGRVQIAAYFDCKLPLPDGALGAAGLAISASVKLPPYCVVEGWAAPETLPSIASVSGVTVLKLPVYSQHHRVDLNSRATPTSAMPEVVSPRPTADRVPQSSIDGAAINIMHSDEYTKQTGSNGGGVTIAVFSDDVTSLAVIQKRHELPRSITVFSSAAQPTRTDEGTMMLEEIHAIAPGAALAFCAVETEGDYGTCLQESVAAHVNIIVDDEGFPGDDLMSTNGTFAQGVQSILAANPGVTLFSSSGNNSQAYWQGQYSPTLFTVNGVPSTLTCGANGQVDSYSENFGAQPNEVLTLTRSLTAALYLQWADPFGQNTSNFDFYILDASFNVLACAPGAGSTVTFNELLPVPALAPGTYFVAIGTPDETLAGKFLKLDAYADGAGALNATTGGSVDSPQKFISGVQTIGAVDGSDGTGNNIEPFSGTGPIQLEFPSPATTQAPIFVAPDNVAVDNKGTLFPSNPFLGTSAATPNAAAVLALLESAFPGASPTSLLASMREGAVPLGNGAPNGTFGYGRVDAIGALNAVGAPTISPISNTSIAGGQSSGPLPFTITGIGNLTVSTSSDNSALVSVGANGDVSVTPQGCGTTTNACNLTITPTLGQIGTANVTLTVTDGAQRFASATFTVTVTKPAPPAVTVTAGASQTVIEGKAAGAVTFVMTGTGPLTAGVVSSNASLLPNSSISLSSGCGTTTDTCTATPTLAAGQTGSATITISAQDPYGQSGSGATATVTVAKPAPPTVKVTAGGSQTITEGTAASAIAFVMTGTGSLTPTVLSSNPALLPNSSISLSSGCGTTTDTCTATPLLAAGQTGSATITISARDPYGQSGAGTAALQVNAPPPPPSPSAGGGGSGGGGGALDLWVLLGLGGLTLIRVIPSGGGRQSARAPASRPRPCDRHNLGAP